MEGPTSGGSNRNDGQPMLFLNRLSSLSATATKAMGAVADSDEGLGGNGNGSNGGEGNGNEAEDNDDDGRAVLPRVADIYKASRAKISRRLE